MKTVSILLALLALPLVALAAEPSADELVDWMTGSFDSGAQAAADSAYFDIRLEMVSIWTDRDDGPWMYIEQAVAGYTDKPYRQRVYHLVQLEDDLFKSEVYAMPDPESRAGCWRDEDPLGDLDPADLELRDGCAVFLRWDPSGEYTGGTIGRGCASDLHGATYANSFVRVTPDRLESWDRGFDADDEHIWGAEKGAYMFIKSKDLP